MPQTPHIERHFMASDVVRDVVIGMADGLTVPFALAAGLTGAIDHNAIIITAGLAEIAAGSIAMGLGGYMAAKSDAEHYAKEREREKREVAEIPHEEMREVAEVFQAYGLNEEETWPIVQALKRQPRNWVDFMMRFELGLEKPDPSRALKSAMTIAGVYAECVAGLWIYKRALHGNSSGSKRPSDCFDRQRRSGRRIRDRKIDRRLTIHPQITQMNFCVICGCFLFIASPGPPVRSRRRGCSRRTFSPSRNPQARSSSPAATIAA